MTREEAIKRVKRYLTDCLPIVYYGEVEEIIEALEQEPVLDKIRTEIEQLSLHKAQFLTNDNKVCIDSQEVLNIIDKYKEESENP